MKPMPLKKRRFYFYTLFVVFFIVIPIITLYTSGYRISKDFKIVETGGIYIYSPETGSEIYINNKKKDETSIFKRDIFVQNLKPDTYAILIAKEGFWPWAKDVEVRERHVSEAIAFLVPKEPDGTIVTRNTTEFVITDNNATTTLTKPNAVYEEILALFELEKKLTLKAYSVSTIATYKNMLTVFFSKFMNYDLKQITKEQMQSLSVQELNETVRAEIIRMQKQYA